MRRPAKKQKSILQQIQLQAEAMSRRGRRMYLCEHPTELYSFAEDIDVEGIAERPALLNNMSHAR